MVFIRVLCDQHVRFDKPSIIEEIGKIFSKPTEQTIERIIVHIHGGGFIGMSS